MARLRRRTIATYRMATRYTETPTRKLCHRAIEESAHRIIRRAFSEHGITLSAADIDERGIKLSTSRPIWNDLSTEVTHWEYDITALV